MKRIGLLSDTHGWLDPRLQHHFAACDEIWHAGDIGNTAVTDELKKWKPLRAIHGNIDDAKARLEFPADLRFTVEGVRVWITHIGGRPPRYDPAVRDELKRNAPNLFICGHSHICMVKFDPALNMLYMNPGATGRHGWHKVRTALRFTIDGEKLKDLEVIELGIRGAKNEIGRGDAEHAYRQPGAQRNPDLG
ncbi:MAG: metallophosphoesterase family protein [Flavobacteriales bacterium]|jgi:putative phosphoesterase|nr:metallophosphoesterase family protein [Flavobacteriales bacterium]